MVNNHSGKIMAERLLEFNRIALKKKLENEQEMQTLIKQLKELVKEKFPERYFGIILYRYSYCIIFI